jgi:hypothetical protein
MFYDFFDSKAIFVLNYWFLARKISYFFIVFFDNFQKHHLKRLLYYQINKNRDFGFLFWLIYIKNSIVFWKFLEIYEEWK